MLCTSLSEFIRYENPRLGSKASYTGQISEWMWKHKATGKSVNEYTYGFSYDALNRFRGNKQYLNGKPENRYTEDISYDLNGNPLALKRSGSGRANYSSFAYEGNRMVSFRDGDRTYKYEYDANGNCTKDGMKNLILEYNHLNLPEKIKSGNTLKAVYSWSAEGTKLGVSDAAGYGRYYMGNLIYAKDAKGLRAEAVIFPGGLIRVASDGSQEINYFLCDHLGSVCVIFNAGGKVVERNDYYVSGKAVVREDYPRQAGNRYKYNGKEEQTTGNLGYLDYGARMYETSAGRWLTVDPMAESYYSVSPYAYCANNPVRFIDPDGRDVYILFYTTDDKMFKASAETRKREIVGMRGFNSEKDKVIMFGVSDLSEIGDLVNWTIDTYSEQYGQTAEAGVWSHAGWDGPIGATPTSGDYALHDYQMSLEGWNSINFNWSSEGANMTFYGCNTGNDIAGGQWIGSFARNISEQSNFKGVNVWG